MTSWVECVTHIQNFASACITHCRKPEPEGKIPIILISINISKDIGKGTFNRDDSNIMEHGKIAMSAP